MFLVAPAEQPCKSVLHQRTQAQRREKSAQMVHRLLDDHHLWVWMLNMYCKRSSHSCKKIPLLFLIVPHFDLLRFLRRMSHFLPPLNITYNPTPFDTSVATILTSVLLSLGVVFAAVVSLISFKYAGK